MYEKNTYVQKERRGDFLDIFYAFYKKRFLSKSKLKIMITRSTALDTFNSTDY